MRLIHVTNPDTAVAKLMNIEDDAEKWFDCTHKQWILMLGNLMQNKTSQNEPYLHVWMRENDEGKIDSYVVIQLPVAPIQHSAVLMYIYAKAMSQEEKTKAFDEIKDWLRNRGIKYLDILAKHPDAFDRYGFKVISFLMRADLYD